MPGSLVELAASSRMLYLTPAVIFFSVNFLFTFRMVAPDFWGTSEFDSVLVF